MTHPFVTALTNHSLSELQMIPKSDLHNHAGRGGNRRYIEAWANTPIRPPAAKFASLAEMQEWFTSHVKCHCPGFGGYLKRIEASFVQAACDRIELLSMSFGPDEIGLLGGMEAFIHTMDTLRRQYSPQTRFLPELSLLSSTNVDLISDQLEEIFSYRWFHSIDISGQELAQPIRNFQAIYRQAKTAGLVLKAHSGEFGTADEVMEAVETLELQEIHHGIAAAQSPQIMKWLASHSIRLNVCPTSNVMLGRVNGYSSHPIRTLYDYGVPVTVNTDDLLIFDQSVSEEYLNLYTAGLLSAAELDVIREAGLAAY
ncbi:adenosine deaminase [Paenibacillus sp. PK3_47]|uniref:hypothetical protein n=1 Tax=Paenibacillus sp. PK3_47 TaxID=2072642 RepID=UPI00201D8FCA|nr:hypothetical protein [Paenibacillus sp. PK3_47]UQZ32229.1 adenosine deaminase [Paenibacillus sp. PK3_47]